MGSVAFELDGQFVRIERNAPLALAGDGPGNDYLPWTPSAETRVLKVTPYATADGTGEPGVSITVSFTVIDTTPPILPPIAVKLDCHVHW